MKRAADPDIRSERENQTPVQAKRVEPNRHRRGRASIDVHYVDARQSARRARARVNEDIGAVGENGGVVAGPGAEVRDAFARFRLDRLKPESVRTRLSIVKPALGNQTDRGVAIQKVRIGRRSADVTFAGRHKP
jgi:hypothetical protein